MRKKGFLLGAALMSVLLLAGCGDDGAKVTNLEISNKDAVETIISGQSLKLENRYEPNDLKKVTLVWESDNESVATVSDGLVKGVGSGEATINLSVKNGTVSDSVVVTVRDEIMAEGITLSLNELTLDKGDAATITAEVMPADTDNREIKWSSSDEKILIISESGEAKAKDYGEAVITAEAANGVTAQCKVSVQEITAEGLDAKVSEQPLRVTSTNYVVQSAQWKSLYPDMLSAVIYNDTDKDIKNAVIAFAAWDSNNLPVKIAGQFDFNGGEYIKKVIYNEINLIPGASYGDKSGFNLSENLNIAKFKAIVVSYETFDGDTWSNPLFNKFEKIYSGVKLS